MCNEVVVEKRDYLMLGGLWWLLDADGYTDELVWPTFSAGMQRTQYTQRRETDCETNSESRQERERRTDITDSETLCTESLQPV